MGTEPVIALLPSPLLGPAVWARTAEVLRARGREVVVPAPFEQVRSPGDVLETFLTALPPGRPLALVPHSNAGLYAAALADARDVRGIVFADARLPEVGRPAPAQFRDFLGTLADDRGVLPVWTQWWSAEEVAGLFPDARAEAAVMAEQRRLPLAYFDEEVPAPPGWEELPSAYLAFGDTYADELAVAEARGWPVRRLGGRHLHPLVDPAGVAHALEGLLGLLGLRATR